MASTAVSIEIAVPTRSMSAKPRTLAVATANSTRAVIIVTTLASTIVAKPFVYPVAMAARTLRPARASSLMRSKMTTFASAATPSVRTRPAMPGQRQGDVEEEHRGVEQRRVHEQAEHGDEAEEAVEDQQEERHGQEADERCDLRLLERVLAERGRDVRLVERHELDRQRAGLEDDRDLLRLVERVEPGDLGATAADAARERVIGVVDLRPGADLAVEHDREVLRLRCGSSRAATRRG